MSETILPDCEANIVSKQIIFFWGQQISKSKIDLIRAHILFFTPLKKFKHIGTVGFFLLQKSLKVKSVTILPHLTVPFYIFFKHTQYFKSLLTKKILDNKIKIQDFCR